VTLIHVRWVLLPCTCDELDDGAEEEESAVEEEAHVPPVLPQQPIQNLKPLLRSHLQPHRPKNQDQIPHTFVVFISFLDHHRNGSKLNNKIANKPVIVPG
jgi:hypothetical protein